MLLIYHIPVIINNYSSVLECNNIIISNTNNKVKNQIILFIILEHCNKSTRNKANKTQMLKITWYSYSYIL